MLKQSKDPVCGMNVNEGQSQFKAEHEGKEYTFCCQQCMNKFKQNPKQYSSK